MSKQTNENVKFGKKHDKKNCPYCKSHRKHPNGFMGKKPNVKGGKKPTSQKEGVGLVTKMVKIARGILFDVCAHANEGDKFGYYVTDLNRGKWNHVVVNSKNEEKDWERKADVIWSYEEGKFVKDKNGVMEIACLVTDDAEVFQSRYEDDDSNSCEDDDVENVSVPREEISSEEVKDGKVVKSYSIDFINGTFKNNITGEEKRISEMTDEERKDVVSAGCQDKHDKKHAEEQKNGDVGEDVMNKAVAVAHRLKDERDAALSQLKKMTIAYKAVKTRMDAIEKVSEFKDVVAKIDRIAFVNDSNKKERNWKRIILDSFLNMTCAVGCLLILLYAAIGFQKFWTVMFR